MENQRTQQSQERPGSTKPRQPQRRPADQPGTQQQPKDRERQRDRRSVDEEE
jgi:hypothetical protein